MRKPTTSPAQQLLDADNVLRAAADRFAESEDNGELDSLREAAIAFADAWRACEEAKARR